MLNNIKLGFYDIYKDKLIIFFYVIFLCFCIFIVNLSMFSYASSIRYQNKINGFKELKINEYSVVPLTTEPLTSEQILNDMSQIYENDAFGYLPFKNSFEDNYATFLLFGDVGSIYPELKPKHEVMIFASERIYDKIQNIKINDIEYKEKQMLSTDFTFYYSFSNSAKDNNEDILLIVVNKPNLLEWFSLNNYSAITNLIENTKIKSSAHSLEDKLLNIAPNELYISKQNVSMSEEITYLETQLYPFLSLVVICVIVMFIIIMRYKIKIKIREYAIYLLCGATIFDLSVRMLVYLGFILIAPLVIMFIVLSTLNAVNISVLQCYITIVILIMAVDILYLNWHLRKLNLMENIMGGKI